MASLAAMSSRSAPVTPAGWSLATPRQQLRSKHRLSADIDRLLSQMHDIDFGLDGGEDEDTKEEMRNSVIDPVGPSVPTEDTETSQPPAAPTMGNQLEAGNVSPVSETAPTSLAYQAAPGSLSPTSPALELRAPPLDSAQEDAGERPSSADLLVLGSIMTQSLA